VIIYFLGILVCLTAGFLLIRLLTAGRLNLILHILLALVLGLGIAGTTAFYTHILFNQFNHWLPIGIVILFVIYMFFLLKKFKVTMKLTQAQAWGLLTLGVLAIPLIVSAYHYPLGGWDAWS